MKATTHKPWSVYSALMALDNKKSKMAGHAKKVKQTGTGQTQRMRQRERGERERERERERENPPRTCRGLRGDFCFVGGLKGGWAFEIFQILSQKTQPG